MRRTTFSTSIENTLIAAIDKFKEQDRRPSRNSALNELLYRNPEIQKILAEGVTHLRAAKRNRSRKSK